MAPATREGGPDEEGREDAGEADAPEDGHGLGSNLPGGPKAGEEGLKHFLRGQGIVADGKGEEPGRRQGQKHPGQYEAVAPADHRLLLLIFQLHIQASFAFLQRNGA